MQLGDGTFDLDQTTVIWQSADSHSVLSKHLKQLEDVGYVIQAKRQKTGVSALRSI
jgi:hypothetical protein